MKRKWYASAVVSQCLDDTVLAAAHKTWLVYVRQRDICLGPGGVLDKGGGGYDHGPLS